MLCNECLKISSPLITDTIADFKERCLQYISQNNLGEITLSDISKKLGYEYHYFSLLFNKCFNMNFRSFINILRVDLAIELISKKDYNLTQLAGECGFQSTRNFNRVFKEITGVTPKNFKSSKNNY